MASKTTADPPRVFVLGLQPVRDPDGVPVEVRLRRLLKAMLRGYRLKCVEIAEERQDGATTGTGE